MDGEGCGRNGEDHTPTSAAERSPYIAHETVCAGQATVGARQNETRMKSTRQKMFGGSGEKE